MTEKTNNEREILQAILRALDKVSEEGQERILRTVSTFYGLDLSNGPRLIPSAMPAGTHIATTDRRLNFSDRETLSPKDFLHGKLPKTDTERVACLAFYLSQYRDTQYFKTIDISKLNTEAAQIKFSNPAAAVANTTASGLVTPAGSGKKQISAFGERFVDALPNREDAKAVLNSMRKRRSRKRSSNTKKGRKASRQRGAP